MLRTALLLSCTLLATSMARAEVRFSGYVKSFAVAQQGLEQSQNSLRLMWNSVGEHSAWQVHYEVTPVFLSQVPDYPDATLKRDTAWRLSDITPTLVDHSRRPIYQNLDRFNVQFNFAAGDLTVGRQPITFGVARVINPTDVFLPFDVRTFNQEYRFGVDAVRFQHPFGQLSELDTGVILGRDGKPNNSAAFLQVRTNVNGKDLQFALIRFAEQSLVGGGMQTSLGDFGFWFEAAGVYGDYDYWRVSTGLDYAFSENVYGLVEYHFNGAGSDTPASYLAQLNKTPYQRGGVFLLGRNYIIPSVSFQVSPLWSVSLQVLSNLSDHSTFAALAADWNISENAYLGFGYYHFMGGARSEYGSNPETAYASLRYYF